MLLGTLGHQPAANRLVELLESPRLEIMVTAAWALGRRILAPPRHRILSFLAGLAILRAVALIPVLGALAFLAAAIVGLGLLAAAVTAAREPAHAPGT